MSFVIARDVLEKVQKKHCTRTLILLSENGRVLNGEQYIENARSYHLIHKPKPETTTGFYLENLQPFVSEFGYTTHVA